MPTPPRSVKIAENERGGWSSERPRRPGEPERPPRLADVSVRGRVLAPSDRLRYAPGSLLLLVGADAPSVEALGARVLTVCDVYDALVSDRVYRPAWSRDRAIELLREESGAAFDPECVAALERVLARAGGDPGWVAALAPEPAPPRAAAPQR